MTDSQAKVLAVLAEAGQPLRRPAIGALLGHAYPPDHRTLSACLRRGWVTGDFKTGFAITAAGRDALAEVRGAR